MENKDEKTALPDVCCDRCGQLFFTLERSLYTGELVRQESCPSCGSEDFSEVVESEDETL